MYQRTRNPNTFHEKQKIQSTTTTATVKQLTFNTAKWTTIVWKAKKNQWNREYNWGDFRKINEQFCTSNKNKPTTAYNKKMLRYKRL